MGSTLWDSNILRNTPKFWVVMRSDVERITQFSNYDNARRYFDYVVEDTVVDASSNYNRIIELVAGNGWDGHQNGELVQAITVTPE